MDLSFRLMPGRNSTAGLLDFNVELGENRDFGLCFEVESKKSDFLSEAAIVFLVLLRLLVVEISSMLFKVQFTKTMDLSPLKACPDMTT